MPIDRDHAFADCPAYGHPLRRANEPLPEHRERVMRAWNMFLRATQIDDLALLGPNAWCMNKSGRVDAVRIGPRSIVRGLLRIESFGRGHIHIADEVYIGDDVLISASAGVDIGAGTLLAHGVQIFDNNSHPMDWRARRDHFRGIQGGKATAEDIPAAPVRIGENAWIAMNSLVFRGVTIGDRSIVAGGSVVVDDIPPDTIAAGNPACPIRRLDRS